MNLQNYWQMEEWRALHARFAPGPYINWLCQAEDCVQCSDGLTCWYCDEPYCADHLNAWGDGHSYCQECLDFIKRQGILLSKPYKAMLEEQSHAGDPQYR